MTGRESGKRTPREVSKSTELRSARDLVESAAMICAACKRVQPG